MIGLCHEDIEFEDHGFAFLYVYLSECDYIANILTHWLIYCFSELFLLLFCGHNKAGDTAEKGSMPEGGKIHGIT
jgi:hypothetical protein